MYSDIHKKKTRSHPTNSTTLLRLIFSIKQLISVIEKTGNMWKNKPAQSALDNKRHTIKSVHVLKGRL